MFSCTSAERCDQYFRSTSRQVMLAPSAVLLLSHPLAKLSLHLEGRGLDSLCGLFRSPGGCLSPGSRGFCSLRRLLSAIGCARGLLFRGREPRGRFWLPGCAACNQCHPKCHPHNESVQPPLVFHAMFLPVFGICFHITTSRKRRYDRNQQSDTEALLPSTAGRRQRAIDPSG